MIARIIALVAVLATAPAGAADIVWDPTDANAIDMVCAFHAGYKLTRASPRDTAGCYWKSWNETHIVTPPSNMEPGNWNGLTLFHILEHECKHAYRGNWHKSGENGDESDLDDYAQCANDLLTTGHSHT